VGVALRRVPVLIHSPNGRWFCPLWAPLGSRSSDSKLSRACALSVRRSASRVNLPATSECWFDWDFLRFGTFPPYCAAPMTRFDRFCCSPASAFLDSQLNSSVVNNRVSFAVTVCRSSCGTPRPHAHRFLDCICTQLPIQRLTTAKKSPVESPDMSVPAMASIGPNIRH